MAAPSAAELQAAMQEVRTAKQGYVAASRRSANKKAEAKTALAEEAQALEAFETARKKLKDITEAE